uniref:Ubiquitin carboxyl-terminal hydrolase n=1 Tax=Haemonchus contortus TaxID=6289 RepID=A0A7I5EDI0_HAECO
GAIAMAKVWQALESNPDTINPFMAKIGVETVQCVDIISFDDDALENLPKPQYAVLLCLPDYKRVNELMAPIYEKLRSENVTPPPNVFFMEQKISNACGTFALFHALANIEDQVDLGSGSFHKWLEAAKSLGIDQRSDLLANDESLAAAHDEAARSGDSHQPEEVEHHFICYVNKDGTLFEIDSRAPFPRALGTTSGDTLVKDAGAKCKQLMEKLDNVSFAAMALVPKV